MNTIDERVVPAEAPACAACGGPAEPPGKGTPLCSACRTGFIAYPIPGWIKMFGGGLLCVLLFSLFTLPKNIQTGIHYKRGLVAAEKKNFLTAEKEFKAVAEREPDYLDARCQLLIASFYNNHFPLFMKTSEALEGKKIDDQELFNRMQSLIGRATSSFPKDSFVQIMQRYNMNTDSVPGPVLPNLFVRFPR